jgi:uncharacterized protein (UPF0264 family)
MLLIKFNIWRLRELLPGPLRYQRLLTSIFDWEETIEALHGGAGIIDSENPATALGDIKPTEIIKIRRTALNRQMSCNIGEDQVLYRRIGKDFSLKNMDEMAGKAAQAALGVASCGVDIIKVGLDNMEPKAVRIVLSEITNSLNSVFPKAQVCTVFFANEEKDYKGKVDPFTEAVEITKECGADAIMVDTRESTKKKKIGLAPYLGPDKRGNIYTMEEIQEFVDFCHKSNIECMLAGSVQISQAATLWSTGCDVIAVRGAIGGRNYPKEKVKRELVAQMIPSQGLNA